MRHLMQGSRSERRLRFEVSGLFGNDDGQLGLSAFELGLDFATLVCIVCVPKFGAQFLDLGFQGVGHRHLLIS